ncbi:MAG: hypothetical protein Q8R36_01510 [bacterium]|nr:hypothetical protein [bacterium]
MNPIEKQLEKYYENIKLTSTQREDVRIKHNGVCEKLHDYYYRDTTYSGSTKLLIGSYGKHTSIRPARDIDVIFIMPPEKFEQYDDNMSNKQSQLLQDVKKILEDKYPNTSISAFGKIVKLEFADTNHDVELVPGWENNDGTFTIPDSENGGSWITQDYRKEISDIADSDVATGKTKFLIRSVKKWSENCTARLRTYQIERMVLSFFSRSNLKNSSTAQLFVNFFHYFLNNTIDQSLCSYINTALSRAQKALDFETNSKLEEAADEWKKIFGDDFPKTIKIATEGVAIVSDDYAKLIKLHQQYPSSVEEYLTKKYGIPFDIDPTHNISLDADITKQNGFRDSTLLAFLRNKLPVQKKKKLLFRVSHDVPSPYEIKWKIRNFGEEAKDADGLRGQIHEDLGHETREESTLYYGEHYVECYIIKNNKCVAMCRILVPIGNNY